MARVLSAIGAAVSRFAPKFAKALHLFQAALAALLLYRR